jgi:putative flippase GtrA
MLGLMPDSGASPPRRALLGLAVRFGAVGLINTAAGFALIELLDIGLGVAPAIANACGYLLGVSLGFVLNRSWVFRYRGDRGVLPRYIAAVAVAFIANQAVLAGVLRLAAPSQITHTAAQLAGMATYTVLSFAMFRGWVFRGAPPQL